MRARIQAIIFDYGNVLSGPQPQAEVERMASLAALPVTQFTERYWRNRLAFDEAALDAVAFWHAVAEHLTAGEIERLTELDCRSWTHPNPRMPGWARQVREAGIGAALLSNMPFPVRDFVLRCEWLPEFDFHTFSCDLRTSKPAPEIYRHCLEGLRAEPSEALLLDDREENVRGAIALGMHGILFTTAAALAGELEKRFDIPAALIDTLKRTDEINQ